MEASIIGPSLCLNSPSRSSTPKTLWPPVTPAMASTSLWLLLCMGGCPRRRYVQKRTEATLWNGSPTMLQLSVKPHPVASGWQSPSGQQLSRSSSSTSQSSSLSCSARRPSSTGTRGGMAEMGFTETESSTSNPASEYQQYQMSLPKRRRILVRTTKRRPKAEPHHLRFLSSFSLLPQPPLPCPSKFSSASILFFLVCVCWVPGTLQALNMCCLLNVSSFHSGKTNLYHST